MLTYVKRSEQEKNKKIELPSFLHDFVIKNNEKLILEQQEYEKEKAKIEIEVYLLNDFDCITNGRPYAKELTHDTCATQSKKLIIDGENCTITELTMQIFGEIEEFVDEEIETYRMDTISWNSGFPVELGSNFKDLQSFDFWSCERKIKEFNIVNGSKLLVWKGNEVAFSSDISLDIHHFYKEDSDCVKENHFVINTKDTTTLKELQDQLYELTKIKVENQYLCKVSFNSLHFLFDQSQERSLQNLLITDNQTITLEEKRIQESDKFNSIAEAYYEKEFSKITITVVNQTGLTEYECTQVHCVKRDETLGELLIRLCCIFLIDLYHYEKLHLYWSSALDLNKISLELENKNRTLSSYSIKNDDSFILTFEEHNKKNEEIEIQFYEIFECENADEKFSERIKQNPFILKESVDLKLYQLKEKMILMLNEEDQLKQFRIRRLNFLLEKMEIFMDEKKSLSDLGFSTCILLCLEEGTLPKIGEIEIPIFQYFNDSIQRDDNDFMAIYSPLYFYPRINSTSEITSAFQYITQKENVKVLLTENLQSLKEKIADQIQVNSWECIRVWNGNKLLTRNNVSLKKSGINHSSFIVFQVLDNPENINQNDTIFYLYLWRKDISNESDGDYKPNHFVNLGEQIFSSVTGDVSEFLEYIAAVAHIKPEDLVAAKYFYHKRTWMKIEDIEVPSCLIEKSENVDGNLSKKNVKKAKQQVIQFKNIRKNTYLLSHGDVIVVTQCDDEPAWLMQLALDKRIPKKPEKIRSDFNSDFDYGEISGSTREYSRVEHILSIDTGLDDLETNEKLEKQ